MSASRPFQGDTGEGDDFSSQRAGDHGGGPKVGAARGTSRLQGQSYEILRDSTAARPLFFASARAGSPCSVAFVPAAPREVEKLRVFRPLLPVFSLFARAFFVRRPGRPAPRGEVCRPSHAYRAPVSHFSFFPFTASPTPRNELTICPLWVKALRFRLHLGRHFRTSVGTVGDRRNGRGAKLANSC